MSTKQAAKKLGILLKRLREEHKAEWRQEAIKELVELFNSQN